MLEYQTKSTNINIWISKKIFSKRAAFKKKIEPQDFLSNVKESKYE